MAIIYTYPTKGAPVGNDLIIISDSQDNNKTKQVKVSTLPSSGGGGGNPCFENIFGNPGKILASASPTANFLVDANTNMVISGDGASNLTWTLNPPTAVKKGGVTALAGPSAIPSQSPNGTWYPIDNVEIDTSRLAVRIPSSATPGDGQIEIVAGTGLTGGGTFTVNQAGNTTITLNASATGGGVDSVTTTNGSYINLTPSAATTGAVTVTADLSAINGAADTTTKFLSIDNKWAVPAYTTDTTYTYGVSGTTNPNLRLSDGSTPQDIQLIGAGTTTITGSAGQVTISSTGTGTAGDLGFQFLSIYEAENEVAGANQIYRQSVSQLDCAINKVDFFVTSVAGQGESVTIAVYTGALGGSGNRRLLGTKNSVSLGINTITFLAPYTFNAGDDIVIYSSQTEGVSLAGNENLLNNVLLSRGDVDYDAAPPALLATSEQPTSAGVALHFYNQ